MFKLATAALVAFSLTAIPARADDAVKTDRGKVAGTIDGIDAAGHLSVTTHAGVKHFTLTPRTRVTRAGQPADPASLKKGEPVRALRFDRKTDEALSIEIGPHR